MNDRNWGFRTRALHAGGRPDPTTGSRAVPIYQSTSFVFEDTADAADKFALQKYGNVYTRISNPTINAFEERMASLEGGIGSVATASGMSAEFLTAAALAHQGDNLVTSSALYGGTHTLFDVTLGRFGIEARFVDGDDPDAYARAIDENTKFLYTEIVGNPSGSIPDLTAIAEVAHSNNLPLVVDGTFATPYLCQPLTHGADIVLHSATKFIGGHGNSIGGVVTESGQFDWGSGRFPQMTEPVDSYNGLKFWENFGEYAFCTKLRAEQLRDIGASMSPINAFLLLHSQDTIFSLAKLGGFGELGVEQNAVSSHDFEVDRAFRFQSGRSVHPGHSLPNVADVLACVEQCRRHKGCTSVSVSTSRHACFWFARPCTQSFGELHSLGIYNRATDNRTFLTWLDDFATVAVK